MVKLDGNHGDGDDHKMLIKCFTFGKEEREKQKWAQGKGITYRVIFWFGDQDTIESVITFRIDNRTIKKGKSYVIVVIKMPLGEVIHAFALGPSVLTN